MSGQNLIKGYGLLTRRAFSSPSSRLAIEKLSKSQAQARRNARINGKSPQPEKKKKGGMSHYRFPDAVRNLGFEKNAIKITDVDDVSELTAEDIDKLKGVPVIYSTETEEKLRVNGLFKKYQHHEAFSRPVSFISQNTLNVNSKLIQALDKSSKENRFFLTGEKGVGKSTLIAQAHALALSQYNNDVVILNFETPAKIANGTSDYILNKEQNIYQQPMFTKKWMRNVFHVNKEVFKKMPLTRDVKVLGRKSEKNLSKEKNTLYDYLFENREFGRALNAFKFFISELKEHSKKFPVLLTVDDFNGLAEKAQTAYRHADFSVIHVKEFELGKFILDVFGGDFVFDKGGVLAAESKQAGEVLALHVGLGLKQYDPYWTEEQCDRYVAEALLKNGGFNVLKAQNFTSEESRALLEFYRASGLLNVRPYPFKKTIKANGTEAEKAVGAFPEVEDVEKQLEKIILYSYNITQGNPGNLFKITVMAY